MKARIIVNEKEVEEIVRAHLLTKFKVVNSVEVKVSEGYIGYGVSETKGVIFDGVECEVEVE